MSDAVLDPPSPEGPNAPVRTRKLLSWPPPGLTRMQGDLWTASRELGAGGIILVMPLLWVTASEQAFWSLGPLGESWWVILLTSLAGLLVLITGYVDLFRLLRRSARAQANGYGPNTILMVLTDEAREAGFVLQGARSFSALGAVARRRILRARIVSTLLVFGAALWISVGFAAGIVLAGRGLLGPDGLTFFVLLPTAGLGAVAAGLRAWEKTMVRRARRTWHNQPWSQDLAAGEVHRWQEEAERRTSQVGLVRPSSGSSLGFTAAAGLAAAVALCVVAFSVVLSITSAVSPVMAMISVPSFRATQERAAKAEFLRRYTLEVDPALTPQEGGQAFHSLSFVGGPVSRDMELAPSRVYEEPWYPGDGSGNPTGIDPQRWATELFPALAAGEIDADGAAYLERVAAHPAHAELARAARASAVDLGSARYQVPFPDGTSMWELPIPRYGPMRSAAYAHIGRAGHLAREGRMAEAEQTLRQVISAGLRLADEGPQLLDNLVGLHMADSGAEALAAFYDYAGRADEAENLRWLRASSEQVADASRIGRNPSPSTVLARMPEVVTDTSALRGLRWEFLATLNTLSPCINLHRMVFGPDREYQDWLSEAEASLVRYPGEGEVFELSRGGFFGRKGATEDQTILGAVLAIPMGGGESTGSCARLFRSVSQY